jgi:hypothetical protein
MGIGHRVMWTRVDIEDALQGWLSAQYAVNVAYKDEADYDYQRGLAAGYVGALEMVLRNTSE